MSSEFLDVDDDDNGTFVLLSMKVSGDAFLTVSGMDENKNYYHFSPDETGWKNAEKIVMAINEWIRHTKSINRALKL